MGYNFGCMIASDTLLILGVGFPGQAIQWAHSRFRGSKGRCHGNHFWLSIYGCTLEPSGKYDWAVCVRRWCSLMSVYFDRLLLFNFCHPSASPMWIVLLIFTNHECGFEQCCEPVLYGSFVCCCCAWLHDNSLCNAVVRLQDKFKS